MRVGKRRLLNADHAVGVCHAKISVS
jgi:hypothetical protein